MARLERDRGGRGVSCPAHRTGAAAQAPGVPALVQPVAIRVAAPARFRHPAQPRRLLHQLVRRPAGALAGTEIGGQGQSGARRSAGLRAAARRGPAQGDAAPGRCLHRDQRRSRDGVRTRRRGAPTHTPAAQRRGHATLLPSARNAGRGLAANAAVAARPTDRPVPGRPRSAQEHPLAGRAMDRERGVRHRGTAAGRRTAGARGPRWRAALVSARGGPPAPGPFRTARVQRRRRQLLPVRRRARFAFGEGGLAQRGARSDGLRLALCGDAGQWNARVDRRGANGADLCARRRRCARQRPAAMLVSSRPCHGRTSTETCLGALRHRCGGERLREPVFGADNDAQARALRRERDRLRRRHHLPAPPGAQSGSLALRPDGRDGAGRLDIPGHRS